MHLFSSHHILLSVGKMLFAHKVEREDDKIDEKSVGDNIYFSKRCFLMTVIENEEERER